MPTALRTFNVYCDESCHLEHDRHPVMVLGIVWCGMDKTREIAERIRDIKKKHGLPATFEMKWSKVSPSGRQFYLDIVDYFFDNPDLHFRGLVANKSGLTHESFQQSHNDWYHKMFYVALQTVLAPRSKYRIYFDIKDTRSGPSLRLLHDILCHRFYDFDRRVIEWVQAVRSNEIEQVQIADLMAGALGYAKRSLATSSAKLAIVERIRKRSGYSLLRNTLFREEKFNVFHWDPQGEPR
jgi:hypothetical protein